jgi:hypothetical protein
MNPNAPRGRIYRCPVCGAELTVLAVGTGEFAPRCCDRDMVAQSRCLVFYLCPVCGAEIAVLLEGGGRFEPRCCNTDMRRAA